jgi:hypothetical protein
MNRRTFISQGFWAIIGFGIISPSLLWGADRRASAKSNKGLQGYRLDRTIFCQFDNEPLNSEIEKIANDLGCRVFHGDPGSFDIIGVPCFISIVDRRLVGRLAWDTFLGYRRETGDHTPCLVIDSRGNWDLPSQRNFIFIDLTRKKITNHIKNLIVEAKGSYSQRYYG